MRMLRQIDAKVDKLVTREVFDAEARRVDERFASQGQDIVDERVAREKAVLEVEQDLMKAVETVESRLDSIVAAARWALGGVGAVLLAVLVFVLPHLGWR